MSSTTFQPYPGPRPFRRGDRDLFFGRVTEASLLAEWWLANRLAYVVGPAGRGKTSLLQAGVLPLLAEEKRDVLPIGCLSHGTAFPLPALPEHNPYTLALLRSWAPGEAPTRLAGLTVREFIQGRGGTGPVLAAIDPVDDLPSGALTASSDRRAEYRDQFLRDLADALGAPESRLHLLVAGRFPTAIEVVARRLGGGLRYDLPPLTEQAAIEAVCRPMRDHGRGFADGAAERLVADLVTSRLAGDDGRERYVTDSDVEPVLLQVACAHLLEALPPGDEAVTAQQVRVYGNVDEALATWVRTVIAEVAEDHELTPRRVASWLKDTFITDLGTRDKVHEGPLRTAQLPRDLARALEDRYLLASSFQSGSRWYELLSDRLIEPVRQVADAHTEHDWPTPEPADRLRAAERASAAGQLDLAKRHARELERHARDVLGNPTGLRSDAYERLGQAQSLLGNLAYESEKPYEAEEWYEKAMTQFGAAIDMQAVGYQLAAIGRLLLDQEQPAEAAAKLDAAISRIPNDVALRVTYAQALWHLGAGRAAVAVLTTALGVDGGNRAALRARGEILADLGEAREALRDLNRVPLEGQPVTQAAHALALAGTGDRLGARREVQALTETDHVQHNGVALLYAAKTFALLGEDDAAELHARQASHASNPPLSTAHRETARKLTDRGTNGPGRTGLVDP